MTIRLEMIQTAKFGAASLNPTIANQIINFVSSLHNPDGGYRGRSTASDLYYTVFAMKILLSFNAELPVDKIEAYLNSISAGQPLDLVHLSCLARCWANLPDKKPSFEKRASIIEQIKSCWIGPTGFANRPGEKKSSIYSTFMALSAYQDLEEAMPDQEAIIDWLFSNEAAEEGFAFKTDANGLTPITSGAVILLKHLSVAVPDETRQWLLNRHNPDGGFYAASLLPLPDLLSTATALHALKALNVSLDEIREPCLNFVNSLWRKHGFCGMTVDETVDCEYTFYGLLALGNLLE